MLAEDGSGKGAGLVSAIAQRINARNADPTFIPPVPKRHSHQQNHHNQHQKTNGCGKVLTNGVNGFHNGSIASAINGHTNGYPNGH